MTQVNQILSLLKNLLFIEPFILYLIVHTPKHRYDNLRICNVISFKIYYFSKSLDYLAKPI